MAAKKKTPTKSAPKTPRLDAAAKRKSRERAAFERQQKRRGIPLRKDVPMPHYDGSANWTKLKNADQDTWKYILAAGDSSETGAEYYKELGYEEVLASKDGARLGAGRVTSKEGQPIVMRGMHLMRIARETYENHVEHGVDGGGGQARADVMEKRIKSGMGVESLNGRSIGSTAHSHYEVDKTA